MGCLLDGSQGKEGLLKPNPAATRVLGVIPTLDIGGAERQMVLLMGGLDSQRYSLGLACCRLQGALKNELPSKVSLYDLGKQSRWDFPRLVLRLWRVLADFRPDIILASMEYSLMLAWLSNRLRRPRATLIARKEVMPSQARLGEGFRHLKRSLDQFVDRRVDMIIAPSRGILREVELQFGNLGIPMVAIPNVVDLRRVPLPSRTWSEPDVHRIVAMGRFVAWKRFDLVIKAAAELPRGAAELHLIGDGPERASLERLSRELGISGITRFHGFQPDPFPLLENASIGVLPSEFEPFGNVIVEMFAAGIPVIAFDVDYGPREVIRSGENGMLVPTLDSHELAKALIHLLGNPGLRTKLGAKAREDAERNYSLDTAVRAYEECFDSLRRSSSWARASL
jgi:glycosyltransferase involved in cell wall biosynthesis